MGYWFRETGCNHRLTIEKIAKTKNVFKMMTANAYRMNAFTGHRMRMQAQIDINEIINILEEMRNITAILCKIIVPHDDLMDKLEEAMELANITNGFGKRCNDLIKKLKNANTGPFQKPYPPGSRYGLIKRDNVKCTD